MRCVVVGRDAGVARDGRVRLPTPCGRLAKAGQTPHPALPKQETEGEMYQTEKWIERGWKRPRLLPEQKRKGEMSKSERWIDRRWKRPRLGLDRLADGRLR